MITSTFSVRKRDEIEVQIQSLLESLGEGRVDGVAYDTAWVARLALRYPSYGFDQSLEWLRRHQYPDGTWGAPLIHYHDRYISTLAAIVALQEALKEGGGHPRDDRRVKRGEDALWKLIGKLGRDDSDTVGFPILSAALAEEAITLGLDVPQAPIRYAAAYKKKVKTLLDQPHRDWRTSTLSFSLEALRSAISPNDIVLENNHSVASSPSATAGYLIANPNEIAIDYLVTCIRKDGSGATPAVAPIDMFETSWALIHLRNWNVVTPDNLLVRKHLDRIWRTWQMWNQNEKIGMSFSGSFSVPNVDDTAVCFILLKWGGYPVTADVFARFERADHFCCFPDETNPSVSAHVRLLAALRLCHEQEGCFEWIEKIVKALHRLDDNGTFWWDKWHASPYYVNSTAITSLQGIDDNLARARVKWILRTQNDDGGWGYLNESTFEETAYCLLALRSWDREVEHIDPSIIMSAIDYLSKYKYASANTPLWIGKSLYTPGLPTKSVILGALHSYSR